MATAADVKAALQRVLQSVDMDSTTERMIRTQLETDLGCSMTPYKKIISDGIQDFLNEKDAGEDEEAADEAEREDDAVAGPSINTAGELTLDLDQKKRLSVGQYKGVKRVDLREFYETNGEWRPTQKGISLNLEQWGTLSGQLQQLHDAVEAGHELDVELSSDRRAKVTQFKGKWYLDVREYYEKDGKQRPGKKGVMVTGQAVANMLRHLPAITKHIGPVTGQPAAKKQRTETAAQPSAAEPADYLDLSGSGERRVSVSNFKGKQLVDLREWYKDKGDGSMKPGKKGISLSVADWQNICDHLKDISAAVAAKDMAFKLELSNKRRVSLSDFKGKTYIGVREFYEKNGEMLPGMKGLNMTAEQWAKLAAGVQLINSQLQ